MNLLALSRTIDDLLQRMTPDAEVSAWGGKLIVSEIPHPSGLPQPVEEIDCPGVLPPARMTDSEEVLLLRTENAALLKKAEDAEAACKRKDHLLGGLVEEHAAQPDSDISAAAIRAEIGAR